MRHAERSTDHTSMPTPTSKPSATSPVIAPGSTNTWNMSNVSQQQQNIYTDVNHYLNDSATPRMSTSSSPLCSDSGYSTPSVACSKPPQSPQIVPSPDAKSSGCGGTASSSSSPETTLPDPEGGGGNQSSRSQHGYKFKNDIKQRFTSNGSFENSQEEQSTESTKNINSEEKHRREERERQERPQQQELATANIARSDTPPESWNKQSGCSSAKKSKNDSTTASFSASMTNLDDNSNRPANQVPAFALHPMGTCYIPLVISTSIMEPYLRAHAAPLGICHPVSIPVNFNRPDPVVLMPKVKGQKIEQCEQIDASGGGLKRSHDGRE